MFRDSPGKMQLIDAKEASGMLLFQLDVARSLAAQLVMAVALVHAQGYAHGGLYLTLIFASALIM